MFLEGAGYTGLKVTKVSKVTKVKEFYLFYFYKKDGVPERSQRPVCVQRTGRRRPELSDTTTLGTLVHFRHFSHF